MRPPHPHPPDAELHTDGAAFGPYHLRRLIGRGNSGAVYEAVDVAHQRIVALRLLPPAVAADVGFRDRFHQQAGLAASLTEPHVLPIHHYGEHDGRYFLDLRLVSGTDLATWLRAAGGRLPLPLAVEIVAQVAAALDAAHRVGLVHHHLKPGNVLLTGPPGGEFGYLADLGIARSTHAAPAAPTATGMIVGDLRYAAPELITADLPDHRADVYALGCLLFELVVGRPPFPVADVSALLRAHLGAPPPHPSREPGGLPPGLDEVVARAMAKHPGGRYPTTGALAAAARNSAHAPEQRPAAAQRLLGAPPPRPPRPESAPPAVEPPRPDPRSRSGRAGRRGRAGLIVAVAIAGALSGVGVVLLTRTTDGSDVAAEEVVVEPLRSAGELPFLPAVGADRDVEPPPGTAGPYGGDTPGLFGGSRGVASCDPYRLLILLQGEPAKARAWAAVHGSLAADLPGFLGRLTSVVLRSDTAVTGHRFRDGAADPVQVVLEAGTAVLVDDLGVPRAKCQSGNPLAPPRTPADPRYTGPAWAGFTPAAITTIDPAPAPVVEFTMVDPPTGELFQRPAGSNGELDR